MINGAYIATPTRILQKPFVQAVQEVCIKSDPKPLFCQLPSGLKIKPIFNSGTVQSYTYTSSLASVYTGSITSSTTTL